jgi:hypothetical protein
MKLQNVIGLLDNTITGKEHLQEMLENSDDPGHQFAREFLKINLTELNNIKDHLLQVTEI